MNIVQNGTNEEVKKIVSTLNEAEIPSEDAVGMYGNPVWFSSVLVFLWLSLSGSF